MVSEVVVNINYEHDWVYKTVKIYNRSDLHRVLETIRKGVTRSWTSWHVFRMKNSEDPWTKPRAVVCVLGNGLRLKNW